MQILLIFFIYNSFVQEDKKDDLEKEEKPKENQIPTLFSVS